MAYALKFDRDQNAKRVGPYTEDMSNSVDHTFITRLFGPVSDHTIVEIISLNPMPAELERVALRLAQENDVAEIFDHPLTGGAAKVYDILLEDDLFATPDERDGERSPTGS